MVLADCDTFLLLLMAFLFICLLLILGLPLK